MKLVSFGAYTARQKAKPLVPLNCAFLRHCYLLALIRRYIRHLRPGALSCAGLGGQLGGALATRRGGRAP